MIQIAAIMSSYDQGITDHFLHSQIEFLKRSWSYFDLIKLSFKL